ncbi:MAG: class I SAM-dependent methyltransferase, partial [Pyrinomonadaceae bacterium]
ALEVGSAPGEFLVELNRRLGCVPYGVEYSKEGVEVNRDVFNAHGIDPNNVIHADFFSDEFQNKHRESFDLVVSRGFIEHFTNVEEVLDKHINLLAKDGYLIVTIPNLKGINYYLTRIFHKELIAIHNLDIMEREAFSRLFDKRRLASLFCGYYGVFNFYLFNTKANSAMRRPLDVCFKIQPVLNATFRVLFQDKGVENSLSSPSLIFIGRKIV